MTLFIILCAVMLAIALAAVCLPLWFGGRSHAEETRRAQVLEILRQQAADLEAERAAGRIDTDEYEESRLELEHRVLEETRHEEDDRSGKSSRLPRLIALILAVIIPASAILGYYALGRYTAMDPQFLAMVDAQQKRERGHSQRDMQKVLDDLRAKLEKDPRNPNGWFLLARTAASMNRFDESVEAFKRLNELVPGNADILADMADMMAAANGKVITPEVEKILQKSLSIDPKQWKALALLAMQAWDRERYAEAASLWRRMIDAVPADFEGLDQIRENINEAERLGGVNDNISSVSPNANAERPAAPGAAKTTARQMPPTASPSQKSSVAGTVMLDEKLAAQASPEDVVFIYARPVHGNRMPVAFMKVKVKDLPYNFVLDDTMRIPMGEESLATAKAVYVGARVSRTGNFMPQAGDLEGEMTQPVEVGDRGLVVQITTVRK